MNSGSDIYSSIEQLISGTFMNKALGKELSSNTRLIDDLNLDSLEIMTLFAEVENTFDVTLADHVETEDFAGHSLGELVDLILAAMSTNASIEVGLVQ